MRDKDCLYHAARLVSKEDLPYIHLHDPRHTAVTLLLEPGE